MSRSIAQQPAFTWVDGFGGAGEDYGWAVAVDARTNVWSAGHFSAPAFFGITNLLQSGMVDAFVARYSSSGNLLWVRQAGGAANDDARALAADTNGNVYVTGSFGLTATFSQFTLQSAGAGDIFVAKYDPDGQLLWVRQAGGSGDDLGHGIALDPAANVYVTGYFSGTATFDSTNLMSQGSGDIFVAKYDTDGNLLWARPAGGTNMDEGLAIAVDAAGNSYVTGDYRNTASFDAISVSGPAGGNVFVAKFDPMGHAVWVRQAGGGSDDYGYGIAVDSKTNVCITGTFYDTATFNNITLPTLGGPDIFVAKYDRDGLLLWVRHEGGNGSDNGEAIGVDAADNIYVAGLFLDTASFGTNVFSSPSHADVFTVKYDPAGNMLWALHAGGTAYKAAYGIAVHPQGVVFATGFFRGPTMFGNFSLTNHFIPPNMPPSQRDVFVTRIDGPPPPPPPPHLLIARTGTNAVLSWLFNAINFKLETTTQFPATNPWDPVTNVPRRFGSLNYVTNGITGTNRFYRLRQP